MRLIYAFLFYFFFSLEINCQINIDSLRMIYAINKDTLRLSEITSDSLVYIHSNGLIESKKEFIKSIVSKKIQYNKTIFLDYKSEKCNDIFINKGFVRVEGLFEDTPFSVNLKFISIYKLNNNKKELVYWQSTKIL